MKNPTKFECTTETLVHMKQDGTLFDAVGEVTGQPVVGDCNVDDVVMANAETEHIQLGSEDGQTEENTKAINTEVWFYN